MTSKYWQTLIKINICIPYDLNMPPSATYPRDVKVYVCKKAHTIMFIKVSFLIAPN